MPNLKEIRNRISSVTSTMKITSAMKMVSAAKLKKAQDAITAMKPYSEKLNELMSSFTNVISSSNISYLAAQRPIKKVLIVAIASNRGFCGAFNSNIVKQSKSLKSLEKFSNAEFYFIVIGKKANDVLSKTENIVQNKSEIFDELSYENSSPIIDQIIQDFADEKYDHVEIIYNSFKNAANQIIDDIEKEFESTVQTLLRIVDSDQLLSDNTKLSLSLSRRQPYLDPLNYIQVMLLKAHREIPDEDTVNLDPLLRTIHAIATGMKNTG